MLRTPQCLSWLSVGKKAALLQHKAGMWLRACCCMTCDMEQQLQGSQSSARRHTD